MTGWISNRGGEDFDDLKQYDFLGFVEEFVKGQSV